MKVEILKVQDWIKLNRPDYKGFVDHFKEWEKEGIPFGVSDLKRLSERYNTPVPYMKNGELILDINIEKYLNE